MSRAARHIQLARAHRATTRMCHQDLDHGPWHRPWHPGSFDHPIITKGAIIAGDLLELQHLSRKRPASRNLLLQNLHRNTDTDQHFTIRACVCLSNDGGMWSSKIVTFSLASLAFKQAVNMAARKSVKRICASEKTSLSANFVLWATMSATTNGDMLCPDCRSRYRKARSERSRWKLSKPSPHCRPPRTLPQQSNAPSSFFLWGFHSGVQLVIAIVLSAHRTIRNISQKKQWKRFGPLGQNVQDVQMIFNMIRQFT